MKKDEALGYIAAIIIVALGLYIIFALFVGITNAQNQMNWCQFEKGMPYVDKGDNTVDGKPTGKRWSPNPLTVGLTGECINPGDKGL